MAKYKVCLDPGHSDKTIGAVGPGGTREGDVVLKIALKAGKYLESNGIEVIYTRKDGSHRELYERAKLANEAKADLFVSIHLDANSNRDSNGTTTYCYKLGGRGEILARNIHRELITALNRYDRGVRAENFLVLRATKMPAVLCEVLFVSNKEEEDIIREESNQNRVASAIARGIALTLGVELKLDEVNTKVGEKDMENKSEVPVRETEIFKYRLEHIAIGAVKNDAIANCYEEPSLNSRVNGRLFKGIHNSIKLYMKVINNNDEWYLVNNNIPQWVRTSEIEINIGDANNN